MEKEGGPGKGLKTTVKESIAKKPWTHPLDLGGWVKQ
jgi:hypothetical protein